MAELSKAYNPREVEASTYVRWEKSGYFNPDKLPNAAKRKPFVISMPPPNITGELHIGHALGMTVQDIFIRYQRMRGRAALWVPGTDHAAIGTEILVKRELQKQGVDPAKLSREKFLDHVWAWKEKYGNRIVDQIKRMGASADWSRSRFTMDPGLTEAVQTAFIRMHRDGLIYRGERIVNWCPECGTAVSDLEVDHQQTPGKLWTIAYPLSNGSGSITVATTRPETMLGDTAVAVHPKDDRYRAMIGKTVRLPIVSRDIPIVGDVRVDRAFGTGAVKVTPAHDALDFDIGHDHQLPRITVIGLDGKMTAAAGPAFAGKTTRQARTEIVEQLRTDGSLVSEDDYVHAVGYCERSKTVIEPLVSRQWFVSMRPLAKLAITAVRSKKITLLPKRFEKVYFHWLKNIRDWNISRQIRWGHRLPVWYAAADRDQANPTVSIKSPGRGWIQDPDTLDTWFSSGLWTFSTLGWPAKTKDLKRFHPTAVMETGWDILFFWVTRMVMLSLYFLKQVPFRTIYLHGLILDADGKKMSKSKGTGIDPIPVAEKYGMDALRMSLVVGNAPGQDFRLYEKKIEGYRNFVNKLWNVARFTLSRPRPAGPVVPSSLADKWILYRLNETVVAVTNNLDSYDCSAAGQRLYDFVWHELADWFLESSKVQPNHGVLYICLETVLALLHPFAPFVTEQIWGQLGTDRLLLVSSWPKPRPAWKRLSGAARSFTELQQAVVAVRNFLARASTPNIQGKFTGRLDESLLASLAGVRLKQETRLLVVSGYRDITLGGARFQFPVAAVEQFESWRQKERVNLERYISSLQAKLDNQSFVKHARLEVVEQERQKLAEAKQRLLEL